MDFYDYYICFKALMKKWILSELLTDVILVALAVVFGMQGNMEAVYIFVGIYFICEFVIIKIVFGSLKRFIEYLNINGKYNEAKKNNDELAIEALENQIIEYMKKAAE